LGFWGNPKTPKPQLNKINNNKIEMNLKFIGLAVMLLISNTSAINQDKKT
jgi:hypothetical protein